MTFLYGRKFRTPGKLLPVLSGLMLAAALFLFPETAFAGDLNPNEETLLPYIYGTFEYEGKTYMARKNYQEAAVDYLKQDDVDLTAEQCAHYISRVLESVKQGIDEGYLYEINGGSGETSADGGTSYSFSGDNHTADQPSAVSGLTAGNPADPAGSGSPEAAPVLIPVSLKSGQALTLPDGSELSRSDDGSLINADGWPALLLQGEVPLTLSDSGMLLLPDDSPLYRAADGSFCDGRGRTITLTVRAEKPQLIAGLEAYKGISSEEADREHSLTDRTDTDAFLAALPPIERISRALLVFSLLLTAGSAVIAARRHLFFSGHEKKLRRILRLIASAAFAAALAGGLTQGAAMLVLNQRYQIITRLEQSGYYEAIEQELEVTAERIFTELGLREETSWNSSESGRNDSAGSASEVLSRSDLVVAASGRIESRLSGKESPASETSDPETGVDEEDTFCLPVKDLLLQIRQAAAAKQLTLTEEARAGIRRIGSSLQESYLVLTDWPYLPYGAARLAGAGRGQLLEILFLAAAVAAGVLTVAVHGYARHGVRYLSFLTGGVSVIWLAALMLLTRIRISGISGIRPEYMQKFFRLTFSDLAGQGGILGAGGLVLAALLWLAARIMKDGKAALKAGSSHRTTARKNPLSSLHIRDHHGQKQGRR